MAETAATSDMGIGLSIVFGVLALLAAVGMAVTAYLASLNHGGSMQMFSAVSVAVALLAGGLAIASMHVYER